MSIVHTRVDNRLVHGQVLSAWVPALSADTLVVFDDEAARNVLVHSAMAIAIPPDVAFEVRPIVEAKAFLGSLRPGARVIVLFRDVADAVRAIDAKAPITHISLGNVHFSHDRKPVTQTVYLSLAEVESLERLGGAGVTVDLRTLPRDQPVTLSDVRRRVTGATA